MELIVLLLGELLFAPFIAALILLLELVALGIGGVLDVVGSRIVGSRSLGSRIVGSRVLGSRIPADRSSGGTRLPRRWSRILLLLAAGLVLVTLGTLLSLELFWFRDAVRWALDRVERTTGTQVTCDTASGSLFGGRLRLDGLSIQKTGGPRTRCDLTLESARLRFSIWTLLSDTIQVDSLELAGLRGSFTRLESGAMRPAPRSRKAFQIESLTIRHLDLQITDKTGNEETYRLTADHWHSEPLRSRWLPFDTLFSTDSAGTLAGSGFEIRSRNDGEARRTRWTATGLPGWYLARELLGPFGLIQEGTVDVQVVHRWRRDEATGIDSRWRLVFHHVRAEVPVGLPPGERDWHQAWVTALNNLGGSAPLEFRLALDGSRLTTHGSPAASPAWDDVGAAMVKKLRGLTAK